MNFAFFKPFIPERLLQIRRRYMKKREQQKIREELERKKRARSFTAAEFQELLTRVGLRAGDCVMVHSGIGTFNTVEGGAPAILKSLEETLTPQGTLLFPALPNWGKPVKASAPFNPQTTPSCMGTLAELFRAKPGVQRSLHPTHSVCAIGPRAEKLLADHGKSPYPFDMRSPFYRMCFWRGKILAIGLTLNSITAFHVYEDLLGPDFWLPVYNPEPVEFEIIPPEGAPYRQATYTHSFLSKERDCERLREALLRTQAMTSLRTDYAELFVLDSQRFVLTCLEELLHGRSIYGPQSLTADQQAKVSGALAAHRIAFENPDSTE